MTTYRIKIDKKGRTVIPAAIQRQLQWNPGDDLLISISSGGLCMVSIKQCLRKIQTLVQSYTKGRSMVTHLQKMRRQNAAKE